MEQQLQILMDFQIIGKNNVSLLPDLSSWADICNWLINTPRAYTHENLKAWSF